MIILVISFVVILIGTFAIILGIWCLLSKRDREYKQKRRNFMKKKWQVQNYIDEHREKMKNEYN